MTWPNFKQFVKSSRDIIEWQMFLMHINFFSPAFCLKMPRCVVVNCHCGYDGFIPPTGLRWFKIPKSKARRDQWEFRIHRQDFKITDDTRVCSVHFKEDDYIPTAENKDSSGRQRFSSRHVFTNFRSANLWIFQPNIKYYLFWFSQMQLRKNALLANRIFVFFFNSKILVKKIVDSYL